MRVEPYRQPLRALVQFKVTGTTIKLRDPSRTDVMDVLTGKKPGEFHDHLSKDHFGLDPDPFRPQDFDVVTQRNIEFFIRQVTLPETHLNPSLRIEIIKKEIMNK